MIDPFVLLAPILLLAVVALLQFIGCELVFSPGSGPILIAEVPGQRAKGQAQNADSATVMFPNDVTAGNLLVVAGAAWDSIGPSSTVMVNDTLGTSYTVKSFVSVSDSQYIIYIAWGIAPSSGACTVTVDPAGTSSEIGWGIDEFSGVDVNTPLDVDGGSASGNAANPSATITPVATNALIVATMTYNPSPTTSITPGGSYTEIAGEDDNENNTDFNAVFRLVTIAQPYTVDWVLGTAKPWDLYRVAFRPTP